MCGIVGMVARSHNGFTYNGDRVFWQMLWADTLRGDDATGVIFVNNDASFTIMKEAMAATWDIASFENSEAGRQVFSKGKALIGHNRKKTVGQNTDENAHPFVVDDTFAMVHNGTLRGHRLLADVEVDSEALAITLAPVLLDTKESPFDQTAFEEVIGKVDGAFAIAAYNQKDNCVYLTRNSERPLFFADLQEGFFWASEGHMLAWILNRNGVKFIASDIRAVSVHELIQIDLDTNKVTSLEYLPKKAMPAITTTVKAGTNTLPQGAGTKRLSRQAFKRMRSQMIGREMLFYARDYLEQGFPKTISDGEHVVFLFGENEGLTFDHNVQAVFDIYDLPEGTTDICEPLYRGVINSIEWFKGVPLFSLISTTVVKTSHESKSTVH